MKISLITDTHAGVRLDSEDFLQFQIKFFKECFFPYLKENNITTIIHLGDIFERRKFINFNTLYHWRKEVFEYIDKNFQMYVIQGNHDIYYRDTNKVSALDELMLSYQNISIINEPTVFGLKEWDKKEYITFIPWMTQENQQECLDCILSNQTDTCFGHFELSGFDYHKGMPSKEGLNSKIFRDYKLVLSGHYHTKSSKGNISYLGSPYETTWADYNDQRGFHIFDTETRELEFIKNPFTIFTRIEYSESKIDVNNFDYEQFRGKIVSISVKERTDYNKFELFQNRIHDTKPIDVLPLDTVVEIDSTLITNENIETKELLVDYVMAMSIDQQIKPKLTDLMMELYSTERE